MVITGVKMVMRVGIPEASEVLRIGFPYGVVQIRSV